jgi:hypothetical protein
MLRAIRILRQTVGRNIVADAVVHENEELLAESISRDEFEASAQCKALLGAWPDSGSVERVHDERFANGSVLVVGREGKDWVTLPSPKRNPRLRVVRR